MNPISMMANFFRGSQSDLNEVRFSSISINDNLLIIPGSIIQISNISRVTSYQIGRSWFLRFALLILAVFSWGLSTMVFSTIFQLLSIVFLALFLLSFLGKKYGVQIQTNGVTTDFLITKNQKAAEKLYSLLAYCINNIDSNTKVTIDKSLTIHSGDMILGDQFKDIENSEIINRSQVNVT